MSSYSSTTNARLPLHKYLTEIFALPVELSVPGVCEVLSTGLYSYLTYTGARVVLHPQYDGSYRLDDLARAWRSQGMKLRDSDSTILSLRLLHYSLLSRFQSLYADSIRDVKESKLAWFPAMFRDLHLGCACCIGIPLYCIPLGEGYDEALWFRPEVWQKCFGDANSKIGTFGWMDRGQLQERYRCKESIIWKFAKNEKQDIRLGSQ